MNEIEVKILEVDTNKLTRQLWNLDVMAKFQGDMYAFYYDFPDRRLLKKGDYIRIRTKKNELNPDPRFRNESSELTYKKKIDNPDSNTKIMEEINIDIDLQHNMEKVLEKLGLEKILQLKKRRLTLELEETYFEFDTYEGIPTLLEIEAPNKELLVKYVKLLGYTMKDVNSMNAFEVLKHYNKLNLL